MGKIAIFGTAQEVANSEKFKGHVQISEIGTRNYVLLDYVSNSSNMFQGIDCIDFDLEFIVKNEKFGIKGKFTSEPFAGLSRKQDLIAKVSLYVIPCSIQYAILNPLKETLKVADEIGPFHFFIHPPEPELGYAQYQTETDLDDRICNDLFGSNDPTNLKTETK